MTKSSAIQYAAGAASIMIGAALLNGYILYQIKTESFHQGSFVGTPGHFLAGAAPFFIGIFLLSKSSATTKERIAFLAAIPLGILIALPALVTQGNADPAWLTWYFTTTLGLAAPILIHVMLRAKPT